MLTMDMHSRGPSSLSAPAAQQQWGFPPSPLNQLHAQVRSDPYSMLGSPLMRDTRSLYPYPGGGPPSLGQPVFDLPHSPFHQSTPTGFQGSSFSPHQPPLGGQMRPNQQQVRLLFHSVSLYYFFSFLYLLLATWRRSI
jgi:hypothetical protein